jgi:opacity protein-like surface antigen
MKKFAALIMLTVFILPASAQSLSIGPVVGVSSVHSPDLYTNDYSEHGLGFGSTGSYGLKAKLGFPLLPVSITGQLNYSKFSNDEDYASFEQSVFIAGAGIEWNILSVPGPIKPYAAVDIFYSNFGKLEITSSDGSYGIISGGITTVDGARIGVGLGAGVEFTMLPKITLEASAKYNFNNLIGKDSNEGNINTSNISIGFLYSVN